MAETLDSVAYADALEFAKRVTDSSRTVLGNSPPGTRIAEIAARLAADIVLLADRGAKKIPTIGILGKVGAGKSWLARCFLDDHPDNESLRGQLNSGENAEDRTHQLIWFGPIGPPDLSAGERFQCTRTSLMLDLGRDYLVGDSPGFCDERRATAELAEKAANSTAIKIIVLSLADLRDARNTDTFTAADGAIVLPVLGFEPLTPATDLPDDKVALETQTLVESWRDRAPHARILDICWMPKDRLHARARELVRQRLRAVLAGPLSDARGLHASVESQIVSRLETARHEMYVCLREWALKVRPFWRRVDEARRTLPDGIIGELLGSDLIIRTGVRQRLRADWLDRTPALLFPYRSLAGVLILTAGAWDKLIFAIAGSAPSLAMTFFQVWRNLRRTKEQDRQAIAATVERLYENSLGRQLKLFREATTVSSSAEPSLNDNARRTAIVDATGIERIEIESAVLLESALEKHKARSFSVWFCGLTATAAFWVLLSGPITALYGSYLTAWWSAMRGLKTRPEEFPQPDFSLFMTSFMLSVAPAAIVAALGVWWCCRERRVQQITIEIKSAHRQKLDEMLSEGSFQIAITEPKLDAAAFLLTHVAYSVPSDASA